MAFVIDDNFSTYTTGATTFGSWVNQFGGSGSGGQIVDGSGGIISDQPDPVHNWTPADAHIPLTSKSVFGFAMEILTGPQGGGVISWSQVIQQGNATTAIMNLTNNPTVPGGSNALALTPEADGSISLRAMSGILTSTAGGPANSAIQTGLFVERQVWNFFLVNYAASAIPHGIGFTLGIGASLSVNGVFVVDGHGDTGIPIPSISDNFTTTLGFAGGTSGLITNVVFDSNPLASYPYPATPPLPLARVSQAGMEYAKLPADSKARASQLVMEHLKLPNNSKARVSAMVIEVLKLVTPAPAFGFPEYIRRRIAC